ncbi:hypothetical protein LQG66_08790 [Bradyrhizobium ontarionense]|uniref:Uncharacterized protein n=1 Tax=Bradyrhizobium ontarionense TaxID=2898149 RepID=A0ABY3RNC9_9BRAD|nr:hypothetical protein [Bradyrhizobium sp. A19]UFZ08280.1 hypothetical protein LQG66_08790 [Bradyrhizobium sp. A19]
MSRKFTAREVIARSYPTWDYAMADRLIAWLDDCGYVIVEKQQALAAACVAEEPGSQTISAC